MCKCANVQMVEMCQCANVLLCKCANVYEVLCKCKYANCKSANVNRKPQYRKTAKPSEPSRLHDFFLPTVYP